MECHPSPLPGFEKPVRFRSSADASLLLVEVLKNLHDFPGKFAQTFPEERDFLSCRRGPFDILL
jgi:hypothetical protein